MRISIVGAGLIGFERLEALKKLNELTGGSITIGMVIDLDELRLETVREKFGCQTSTNIRDIFAERPDWVFVCTTHESVQSVLNECFKWAINVFIEKPLGRSLQECQEILAMRPSGIKLAVGFNYRFYSGIESILYDAINGKFGRLISVNMILGHGNAPGMESSWKLDPIICGGGALIDPGIHLLDLTLQLSTGVVDIAGGCSWSGFWNTGIEEEVHLLLKDQAGVVFNLQSSLNRWRSTFKLEINGVDGYGIVQGRGRSYGAQSYRTGKRWGWQNGTNQADSEILVIASDASVDSFYMETASLLGVEVVNEQTKKPSRLTVCNEFEAQAAMSLLDKCQKYLKLANHNSNNSF